MKITKIRMGLGNTAGPKFEPVKCLIEYEVEVREDQHPDDVRVSLEIRLLADVEKFCYEALLRLKGEQEAHAFRKDGV